MKRSPFKSKGIVWSPDEARKAREHAKNLRMSAMLASMKTAAPIARKAVMAPASQLAALQPKEDRHSSEAWRRAVAAIPCVFCGQPAQAAHRNESKAMALKTDDCLCAALCPTHHSEIDQGKTMTREQRRAEMDRAIVLTLRALVHAGKVVLT